MSPRSRGKEPQARSFSGSTGPPPTLKPFLDNLPPPSNLNTPRALSSEVEDDVDEDTMPTPVRPSFDISEDGEDDDNDDDDDDKQGTLDDEEFESHYSQKSSPATSEEETDEDDIVEMSFSPTSNGVQLQRISSVPTAIGQTSQTSTLHTSHSTTSLPPRAAPPIPPPLYPPFYNRPPTPLPPSPSLTSLLRPPSLLNRSTTSTRPTTPDSSDVETPNDTEAAVAHSARKAHPLPPTSPKVPTYEYYGFVLYLASSVVFLMYIFWSYLPSPFLHALGITYYPNRWWSLAIPAWIVMMLIYIYVALACWNVEYLTLGLQRLETIVDEAGNVAILDENGRIKHGGSKRVEWEVAERKKSEKTGGAWNKKGKGSSRKKDSRRKQRDDDESRRYGYMGDVYGGRVASGLTWRQVWNEGTDAVMDVPLGGVCEVLYGEGRDAL